MDRDQLADFLRSRRTALQPEEVGLPRGPRRSTAGLRREEVAALTGMSTDYLARLEQRRGPQPSESMLAAVARGLRLNLEERDHLFRLAGRTPPSRAVRTSHVSPQLLRVIDVLDAPAQLMSDLGEVLAENPMAAALLGPQAGLPSLFERWFTVPATRSIYHPDDHELFGRLFVSTLRKALGRDPGDAAAATVARLEAASGEFRALWSQHLVGKPPIQQKRVMHPEVGEVLIDCQTLFAENEAQYLLIYTATPGSGADEKLRLLDVIGTQRFAR